MKNGNGVFHDVCAKERKDVANMNSRLEELLNSLQKKEEEKPRNVVLWVLQRSSRNAVAPSHTQYIVFYSGLSGRFR